MRWSVAATLVVLACGGAPSARAPANAPPLGVCDGFDALRDLQSSLRTPSSFGASSDLYFLIDADEELGWLALVRKKLPRDHDLVPKLETLTHVLEDRRSKIASSVHAVEDTYERTEAALEATAKCGAIDLNNPAKLPSGEIDEKVRKKNETIAASTTCEQSRRLFESVASLNLSSEISSRSIAVQLREVRLDGDRAPVRDRLSATLKAHAEALHAFRALVAPSVEEQDPALVALTRTRDDVIGQLTASIVRCVERSSDLDRIVGAKVDPRRVTLTVRPKWTGVLASLPHEESFGSGFVVRWRDRRGVVETRVVTNNHVIDGAFDADIVADDDSGRKTTGTLVQSNPHDDIAILKIDSASFTDGLAFRLAPVHEQDLVTAAGFPGLGVRPSFQITKGTVSNAKFALTSNTDPLATYLQHTAPIDAGNSGGPLLDADGLLIGMNTLKVVGRENVGLAVPAPRILRALLRAEQPVEFDTRHAEASCNTIISALSALQPAGQAMSRFGLELFEWHTAAQGSTDAATYRSRVRDWTETPVNNARLRIYGAARVLVEQDGGVRPYTTCKDVAPAKTPGSWVATLPTRKGSHALRFAEEHGVVRLVGID